MRRFVALLALIPAAAAYAAGWGSTPVGPLPSVLRDADVASPPANTDETFGFDGLVYRRQNATQTGSAKFRFVDANTAALAEKASPAELTPYLRSAAASAVENGADGIYFDTLPGSALWQLGDQGSGSAIRDAIEHGRLAAAAVSTAYSAGDVLCAIPVDFSRAGPCWPHFMAAFLRGFTPDFRGTVHLLIAAPGGKSPFPTMAVARRRTEAWLRLHGAEGRVRIGWTLDSRGRQPDAERLRLASVQLLADDYVYIRGTAAIVHTPLEGLVRGGDVSFHGQHAFALRTPSGAGLVVPDGLTGPLHFDQAATLSTVTLDSGETEMFEREGPFDLPSQPPMTLIDGFAARELLPSAAMSCGNIRWSDPPGRAEVTFQIANASAFQWTGSVQYLVDSHTSVVPAELAIDLAPGERIAAPLRLSGTGSPGAILELETVLVSPGAQPVSRRFAWPVPPHPAWTARNDAPLTGRPLRLDLTADGTDEIAWLLGTGQLICVANDGTVLWETTLPQLPACPPVVIRQWHGLPALLAATTDGALHAFDTGGKPLWIAHPEPAALPTALVAADVHASPGSEVIAAYDDQTVRAYLPGGTPLWTAESDGPVHYLTASATGEGGDTVWAFASGPSPSATAYTAKGERQWTFPMTAAPSAAAVRIDDSLCFADGNTLRMIGLRDGIEQEPIRAAFGPITGIVPLPEEDTAHPGIVLASPQHVETIGLDGERRWSVLVGSHVAPACALLPGGIRIAVAGADDVLYLLDDTGNILWEDSAAADAYHVSPVIVPDASGPDLVLQGARDGYLRAIKISGR